MSANLFFKKTQKSIKQFFELKGLRYQGFYLAFFALITISGSTAQNLEMTGFSRFGGPASDRVTAMISDAQGNIYLTGSTKSQNIATPGVFQETYGGGGFTGGDAFVAKLSGETLQPIWVTYLGGNNSENGTEKSGGLALTPNGSIIVVGTTASKNFPTTSDAIKPSNNGEAEDLFIAILSANGEELIYSSYFGGSHGELLTAFDTDGSGNIYLGGFTTSLDFPITSNAQQSQNPGGFGSIFLTRISNDGKTLEYGTYIGGSQGDELRSLFARSPEDVWLGGKTGSFNFPLSVDAFQRQMLGCGITKCDGFLMGINTIDGTMKYSTYLGGRNGDEISYITPTGNNSLYAVGQTMSADFPITNWGVKTENEDLRTPDGFALKFNTDCNLLEFSTLIGGNGAGEELTAILPSRGDLIIGGLSVSRDYPVTENALQKDKPGGRNNAEGVVSGLTRDGRSFFYSSYFGGDERDRVKLLVLRRPRFAASLNSNVFYMAGETNSSLLVPEDSGAMGFADIFISRWLQSDPPLVVTPN